MMLMDFFRKIQNIMDISKPKEDIPQKDLNDTIENDVQDKVENDKQEEIDKQEEVKYVHEFGKCVLLEYNSTEGEVKGCTGDELIPNYSVAAHNIPVGTRIYIPSLKGIVNKDGVFEVMDTGGHCFDFDIFLSEDNIGKVARRYEDVYVLEWGKGKITSSYTYIIEYYLKKGILDKYHKAWEYYKDKGKLIKFFKFQDEDKDLKNKEYYKNI